MLRVVGRFDRFLLVEPPRARADARLLNHPYRFAELPPWWAPLTMALGLDVDGVPVWVFAYPEDHDDNAAYRRDVRSWGSLSHALLPRVVGNGRAEGYTWFATDAVLGAPLPSVVDRVGQGELAPALLSSVVHDFASALNHVIDRRALLSDLLVFDGTVDVEGRVHLHTRVTVDSESAGVLGERQKHMVVNVGGWLAKLGQRNASGDLVTQPAPLRAALAKLHDGDAKGAMRAIEKLEELDDNRAQVAALFRDVLHEEREALRDLVDGARAIDDDTRRGAPIVVPDRPVRRTPGFFYGPTSKA